jgi:MerR family transcriptional regulator, thiopeptide resistance regulator
MSRTTTMIKPKPHLRIGQLADRCGVSAKALRFYEQRGLLKPCTHSESGYRLYGPDALRRLMQIIVLKRSGFTLAEIGLLFKRDVTFAESLFAARIETLERDLADRTQALKALRRMAWHVGSTSNLDLDQLLESIHMSSTLKLDLTNTERDFVRQRAEQMGSERVKVLRSAYPELLAQIRAAMGAGKPAIDPDVIELVRIYRGLAPDLPDVDPAVKERMVSALGERPDVMAQAGLDPTLFRYLCDAIAAAKAGTSA